MRLLACFVLIVSFAVSVQADDERDPIAAQRVRQVLSALNDAIERNDIGSYMLHVDVSERTFVTEQRAWISDALDQDYEVLRYEFFGGMGASQRSDTEIWAGIGIRWSENLTGLPWDRVYIARFVSIDPLSDIWRFAGPGWSFELSDEQSGIRVFAGEHQEELADFALAQSPEILQRIEQAMGLEVHHELVIKIYDKMNDLQASISPAYKDPLSGWNEPGESIKILGRKSLSESRLSSLLAHEIGHAVSFEFGEQIINAPWWSLEGIAELMADEYRADGIEARERRIAKMVAEGDRRKWEQLSDFKGEALNHTTHVYLQGWSMVRYMTDRFGKEARNNWFAAMGAGMSVEEACQEAFNISMDDLDHDWESAIKQTAQQYADQP